MKVELNIKIKEEIIKQLGALKAHIAPANDKMLSLEVLKKGI